jgi:hypothetical protein
LLTNKQLFPEIPHGKIFQGERSTSGTKGNEKKTGGRMAPILKKAGLIVSAYPTGLVT